MGGAEGKTKLGRQVDALIVTAIKLEYDQVLKVDAGAWPGSSWAVQRGPLGFDVALRTFKGANEQPLEVAVTWAVDMGGVATALTAGPLIEAYSPRCIAMCGVCAGRRGDVNVGDVIIADRLWMYDTGKLKVELGEDGERIERVQGDMLTYLLRADWKQRAEAFVVPAEAKTWLDERPPACEAQADWILERLAKGEDPRSHPDRDLKAPDFGKVLELLWKKKLVDDGTLSLSATGRARIDRLLLSHDRGLPGPGPFTVHVGPIGSGNKVVQDPQIFDRLSNEMRKVLGLEMEASAIGAIGHIHRDDIPYMVVMKGVMDHADDWKSDTVKTFAARASAECLLASLRENLLPVDRFGDILGPGTSKRPSDPSPAALLNARHCYVPFFEPGRAAILGDLRAFSDAPDPVGVWLIHGEGGMGKTRLLIEWCERLRAEGWTAGFLDESAPRDRFDTLVSSGRPSLVVIDYAESRPELGALLASVARTRNAGRAGPLRVVLLARNADDWWTDLTRRDGPTKDLLRERAPIALQPLAGAFSF